MEGRGRWANDDEPALASRLTAELFGTFALTLTACAAEIVAAAHPEVSHLERAAAGAVAGAAVACALVGAAADVGATLSIGAAQAIIIEAVLSFLLVSVILHTSKRKAAVGPQAALAVGATIALCGRCGSTSSVRWWGRWPQSP
jgi:glycerol uptake facilitator-like aquaporin